MGGDCARCAFLSSRTDPVVDGFCANCEGSAFHSRYCLAFIIPADRLRPFLSFSETSMLDMVPGILTQNGITGVVLAWDELRGGFTIVYRDEDLGPPAGQGE